MSSPDDDPSKKAAALLQQLVLLAPAQTPLPVNDLFEMCGSLPRDQLQASSMLSTCKYRMAHACEQQREASGAASWHTPPSVLAALHQ